MARPTRSQYGIRLIGILLVMLDVFRRSFLRHDAFDYTMMALAVAILILTAYQIFSDRFRIWRRKRRQAHLSLCLKTGEQLRESVPGPHYDEALSDDWTKQVEQWRNDTNALLASYSSAASSTFLHTSGSVSLRENFYRIS